MLRKKPFLFACLLVFLISCHPVKPNLLVTRVTVPPVGPNPVRDSIKLPKADKAKTSTFFTDLFSKYPMLFDSITAQAKSRNIQVIYTAINRGANNLPRFTDYYFNVDPDKYFYPASTVKLPVSLLALQKLNGMRNTGITANTTMITDAVYSGQTPVYNDPNTPDGRPTVAQYIKKIFLVSDNDAFNRLFEFLGQQYINDELHKMGYGTAQVLHRLDIFLSEDENRHTNPVKFLANDNRILYQQPLVYNQTRYQERNDSAGTAHYAGDSLINMPMNFSSKNRITLQDLHNILRSVIFPNAVPANQRFGLSPDDYQFIYRYMSAYPRESVYPYYDSATYPDSYDKFLMNARQERSLPKNIRIFNKSGEAYGQLTDIAYIIDLDKNIEFFLSATINCTINGIVNNDEYAYESVGYPFLANLGKVIYDFELNRKRSYIPDLSQYRVKW